MPAPTMRRAFGVHGWGTFAEVEAAQAPKTFDQLEAEYVGFTTDEAEARLAAIEKFASMRGSR